jgi:predicted NUDIX family NTP pyrophosphohydrolase
VPDCARTCVVAKHSAGIMPYRVSAAGELEVLLVHPGGPFWAKRDDGWWSIAKGEHDQGEDAASAAEREFREETGVVLPPGHRIDLGEIRQSGGKRVRAWAVEAPDISADDVASNLFEIEWPPRSGTLQSFPEVDRAAWFDAATARGKLVKGQQDLVDRLIAALAHAEPSSDGAAT